METKSKTTPHLNDALRWHFFNMYCMALIDNNFDPKEAELLYKIGLREGIDKSTIDDIILTSGLKPTIPDSLEEKIAYLYDLAFIAWADGKIEEEEKKLLQKNIVKFGFKENNKEQICDFLLDCVEQSLSLEDVLKKIKS